MHRRGRLTLKLPLDLWIDHALRESDVACLPVERYIAVRAAGLPEHHRDPVDRLIIATAVEYRAQLASLDEWFSQYAELKEYLIQR